MRIMQYKRKEERKTDYRKRLKLVSSKLPRMIIRKSLRQMLIQFANYFPEGDRIIVSASTTELKDFGWSLYCRNTPAAYLVGLLAGLKAKQQGITKAIIDIGIYPSVKSAIIYSAVKGAIDAGINLPHKQEIFPSEERISGTHINENTKLIFENTKKAILKKYKEKE